MSAGPPRYGTVWPHTVPAPAGHSGAARPMTQQLRHTGEVWMRDYSCTAGTATCGSTRSRWPTRMPRWYAQCVLRPGELGCPARSTPTKLGRPLVLKRGDRLHEVCRGQSVLFECERQIEHLACALI